MIEFSRDAIAKIQIDNLRLRTFIGIKDEEKANRQDVIINIRIHYHAAKAVTFNVIEEALNYRTITKEVIHHVETNRFLLLERMTDEVLSLVMAHPQVLITRIDGRQLPSAASITVWIFADDGPVKEPKLPTSWPLRSNTYLWKFQLG